MVQASEGPGSTDVQQGVRTAWLEELQRSTLFNCLLALLPWGKNLYDLQCLEWLVLIVQGHICIEYIYICRYMLVQHVCRPLTLHCITIRYYDAENCLLLRIYWHPSARIKMAKAPSSWQCVTRASLIEELKWFNLVLFYSTYFFFPETVRTILFSILLVRAALQSMPDLLLDDSPQ